VPSKAILIGVLNELLLPIGFKKKGSNWMNCGNELTKIINLQKSNFSNSYYINYGYIINGLELTTTDHVSKRLDSSDKQEQVIINNLLNLDSDTADVVRANSLKEFINRKIVSEMAATNTKNDLLQVIKKLPLISIVPLNVRQYFALD
jgi:hypothetical protein